MRAIIARRFAIAAYMSADDLPDTLLVKQFGLEAVPLGLQGVEA